MDKRIKKYIYIRDEGKCFHCGKSLRYNQVNIDHYNPRSKGGVDALYNFVLSCKTCNKYKGSVIPRDIDQVNINLMKRAFFDGKITWSEIKINKEQLVQIISAINKIEHNEKEVIFSGGKGLIVMKVNNIVRGHVSEV
jgi:CRISPR/Cas system Type II protein with McrA/HNH and RuvC-like nuclease domain